MKAEQRAEAQTVRRSIVARWLSYVTRRAAAWSAEAPWGTDAFERGRRAGRAELAAELADVFTRGEER